MRLNNDNDARGLSFTFQSGPGFNLSSNFYTGILLSNKELKYADLEGKGVAIEGGYYAGLSWAANRYKDPLYRVLTISIAPPGFSKGSGNIMNTRTKIILIKALNCERCY